MRRPFQWFLFEAQIHLESSGIARAIWRSESVPALWRRILVFGPCIKLEPIRVSRGSYMTLDSLNQSLPLSSGFGFCLDCSIDNSFAAAVGLWDPNFVRLIIHLQFGCIPLCSCVCSRFTGKDLAFLARSTMQRRSITRGVMVLQLQGSEPSCSEAGSNRVVTPPNRELLEPFGRSGTLVHITLYICVIEMFSSILVEMINSCSVLCFNYA
jgi:hypothetical protein